MGDSNRRFFTLELGRNVGVIPYLMKTSPAITHQVMSDSVFYEVLIIMVESALATGDIDTYTTKSIHLLAISH